MVSCGQQLSIVLGSGQRNNEITSIRPLSLAEEVVVVVVVVVLCDVDV